MQLLADGILAVLAAVGLTAIVWLISALFVRPCTGAAEDIFVLVALSGSADEMEQRVRSLVYLRERERAFSRIIVLDRGLDAEAKARARLLCRTYECVELIENS